METPLHIIIIIIIIIIILIMVEKRSDYSANTI